MKNLRLLCIITGLISISMIGGCKEPKLGQEEKKNDQQKPITDSKVDTKVFDIVNIDAKGLEKVKKAYVDNKIDLAAKELLNYYRNRVGIVHPDVNLMNVTINKEEQKWADESLSHQFFAHKGYQPSYNYGANINWEYWPVQDNELRWQLHRHKWFIPLGKSYRITNDEKYVKAWIEHYEDWIKKNPMPDKSIDYTPAQKDNMKYSWRPLEVSTRLEDQPAIFLYCLNSVNFTPEFLADFLINYAKHANYIMGNFSAEGNHLLFEAQRMIYAGVFFPEFKQAETWRQKGIDILNVEIKKQVYDDGMQYELDFGYHNGAINTFFKALNMAKANGLEKEFPATYLQTIEKMTDVTVNTSYPTYNQPMFSDNKLNSKSAQIRNFKAWSAVYPNNAGLQFMATQGKSSAPSHLSKAFKDSGFFVLRNGWENNATIMILKAGPSAAWHNQPDNGTFELWIKGRTFFPDSGCFIYGGDGVQTDRDWFRQTNVHNTLTLDSKNITKADSKLKLWKTDGTTDILVTENQGYTNLSHRRTVFFVNRTFFVIVDEAVGDATGKVNLNFGLIENNGVLNLSSNGAYTNFSDNNNISVQTFAQNATSIKKDGFVSYEYNKKLSREAYSVNVAKNSATPVRYITVIVPTKAAGQAQATASFTDSGYNASSMSLEVTLDGTKHTLGFKL